MNSGYIKTIDEIITKLHLQGTDVKSLPTVIYARKSTKDENQLSLETQIDVCKRYIEGEKKLRLIGIYSEDKTSGYHLENRVEYSKIHADLQKGKIKVVVYYSVDRETRNEVEGSLLDDEFEELNALQIYATQYFERNADGRFFKSIVRRDGQRSVEHTSERIREGTHKAIEETRSLGARTPYGFKVVEKHYLINDEEAPAVQIIFENAANGMSIPDISTLLVKKGYLTRKGKKFPSNTIWNMLQNEKYKGTYLYAKKDGRKNKYRVAREDFEEVRIEHGLPQIISEELFEKAQKALSFKGKKKPNRDQQTYLLTGVLKCGTCGNLMHGEASIGGHSRKRYCHYKCPRSSNCKTNIRKEYIERATAEVLADAFNKLYSQYISPLTMTRKINSSKKNEIATLNKQISSLEKDLINSAKSLARLTSQEVIDVLNAEIKENLELKKELEKSRDTLVAAQFTVSQIGGYNPLTAEEVLNNKQLFERLLKLFVVDITIEKDNVVFNLNSLKQ